MFNPILGLLVVQTRGQPAPKVTGPSRAPEKGGGTAGDRWSNSCADWVRNS